MKQMFTLLLLPFLLFAEAVEVGFQFDSWPIERERLPLMLTLSTDSTNIAKRDPVQVLYVMDLSEITTGVVKREFINGALSIANALKEGDGFGVILYSEYPRVLFPLTEMNSTKKEDLQKVLENISTESGRDISKSIEKIKEQFSLKENSKTLSKEVVITTTGKFTGTKKSDMVYSELVGAAEAADFRIHTVSYGDDFDADMMINLAEKRGGRAFFSRKSEPESLFVAFDELAGELSGPVYSRYTIEVDCGELSLHTWGDSVALKEGLSFSVLPKASKRYIFLQVTGDKTSEAKFDVSYTYHDVGSGSDISEVVLSEVPKGNDESKFNSAIAPKIIRNSILHNLVQYDEHFRIGGKDYRRKFCNGFKDKVLIPLESAKGRIATPEMDSVYGDIKVLWDQLSSSSSSELEYVLRKMKYMLHSNKYGK